MVPTLNKDDVKKRIVQASKPKTMDNILRKRIMSGESGAERGFKMRLGKYMNSEVPVENPAIEKIKDRL